MQPPLRADKSRTCPETAALHPPPFAYTLLATFSPPKNTEAPSAHHSNASKRTTASKPPQNQCNHHCTQRRTETVPGPPRDRPAPTAHFHPTFLLQTYTFSAFSLWLSPFPLTQNHLDPMHLFVHVSTFLTHNLSELSRTHLYLSHPQPLRALSCTYLPF